VPVLLYWWIVNFSRTRGAYISQVGKAGPVGPRGEVGLQGVGGESSLSVISQCIAGEIISGHRAVYNKNGSIYYADKDTEETVSGLLGISAGAALIGGAVNLVFAGPLIEPSWNWNYPAPIFIGNNGILTQAVPLSGWLIIIANSISPTTVWVNPKEPTLRSN
jgi:hypothetical protein